MIAFFLTATAKKTIKKRGREKSARFTRACKRPQFPLVVLGHFKHITWKTSHGNVTSLCGKRNNGQNVALRLRTTSTAHPEDPHIAISFFDHLHIACRLPIRLPHATRTRTRRSYEMNCVAHTCEFGRARDLLARLQLALDVLAVSAEADRVCLFHRVH